MEENTTDEKQEVSTPESTGEESQSESSTDEQEQLSPDEIIRKKDEQIERLTQHLRNKESKNRTLIEEEDDDQPSSEEARISQMEAQIRELQQRNSTSLSQHQKANMSWLYDQSWGNQYAPENDPEGTKFARFQAEYKKAAQGRIIDTNDDMRQVMRLAAVNVSGDPAPLLEQQQAKISQNTKEVAMASGGGGSRIKEDSSKNNWNGFSQEERKLLERRGITPEEYNKRLAQRGGALN